MKYIMFEGKFGTAKAHFPGLFSNNLVHAEVAKALATMQHFGHFKPVSAGEVTHGLDMDCHGESTTLGLKSHPERDTAVLNMIDYGGWAMGDNYD